MSVAQIAAGRRPRLLGRASSIGWVTIAAASWMALLVVLAIIGEWIAPYDPNQLDLANILSGPTAEHWLGTDNTGRDILSRLIVGVRPTLVGPLFIVAIAVIVGSSLAIVAAWFGGFTDSVISRGLDILFAFPGLVVAMLAVTLFGPGLFAPVIALSIAYIPVLARILRTNAMRERNLPYIAALTSHGASRWAICLRHILPNVLPVITVQAVIAFSYAILDLAAVSYLGLGLQPPSTDWGLMIATGQPDILAGHPGQSIAAAILVMVTVLATSLLGDALASKVEIGDR